MKCHPRFQLFRQQLAKQRARAIFSLPERRPCVMWRAVTDDSGGALRFAADE